MVFFLKNLETENLLVLSNNCDYKIGRKCTNDIVIKSSTVSKFHAELSLKLGRATLTDLNSKRGVIVNGEKISKTVLKHLDIIKFGLMKKTYQFIDVKWTTYVPSNYSPEYLVSVKQTLNKCDIAYATQYSKDNCTHVTTERFVLNQEHILPLVHRKPIVRFKFWFHLQQALKNLDLCPDVKDYLPPLSREMTERNVEITTNLSRNFLFEDKRFVFFDPDGITEVGQLVEACAGRVLEWSKLSIEIKSKITVTCDPSYLVVYSEIPEYLPQIKTVQRCIKMEKLRPIKLKEIFYAVLFGSVEKYCNPFYRPNIKNISEISQSQSSKIAKSSHSDSDAVLSTQSKTQLVKPNKESEKKKLTQSLTDLPVDRQNTKVSHLNERASNSKVTAKQNKELNKKLTQSTIDLTKEPGHLNKGECDLHTKITAKQNKESEKKVTHSTTELTKVPGNDQNSKSDNFVWTQSTHIQSQTKLTKTEKFGVKFLSPRTSNTNNLVEKRSPDSTTPELIGESQFFSKRECVSDKPVTSFQKDASELQETLDMINENNKKGSEKETFSEKNVRKLQELLDMIDEDGNSNLEKENTVAQKKKLTKEQHKDKNHEKPEIKNKKQQKLVLNPFAKTRKDLTKTEEGLENLVKEKMQSIVACEQIIILTDSPMASQNSDNIVADLNNAEIGNNIAKPLFDSVKDVTNKPPLDLQSLEEDPSYSKKSKTKTSANKKIIISASSSENNPKEPSINDLIVSKKAKTTITVPNNMVDATDDVYEPDAIDIALANLRENNTKKTQGNNVDESVKYAWLDYSQNYELTNTCEDKNVLKKIPDNDQSPVENHCDGTCSGVKDICLHDLVDGNKETSFKENIFLESQKQYFTGSDTASESFNLKPSSLSPKIIYKAKTQTKKLPRWLTSTKVKQKFEGEKTTNEDSQEKKQILQPSREPQIRVRSRESINLLSHISPPDEPSKSDELGYPSTSSNPMPTTCSKNTTARDLFDSSKYRDKPPDDKPKSTLKNSMQKDKSSVEQTSKNNAANENNELCEPSTSKHSVNDANEMKVDYSLHPKPTTSKQCDDMEGSKSSKDDFNEKEGTSTTKSSDLYLKGSVFSSLSVASKPGSSGDTTFCSIAENGQTNRKRPRRNRNEPLRNKEGKTTQPEENSIRSERKRISPKKSQPQNSNDGPNSPQRKTKSRYRRWSTSSSSSSSPVKITPQIHQDSAQNARISTRLRNLMATPEKSTILSPKRKSERTVDTPLKRTKVINIFNEPVLIEELEKKFESVNTQNKDAAEKKGQCVNTRNKEYSKKEESVNTRRENVPENKVQPENKPIKEAAEKTMPSVNTRQKEETKKKAQAVNTRNKEIDQKVEPVNTRSKNSGEKKVKPVNKLIQEEAEKKEEQTKKKAQAMNTRNKETDQKVEPVNTRSQNSVEKKVQPVDKLIKEEAEKKEEETKNKSQSMNTRNKETGQNMEPVNTRSKNSGEKKVQPVNKSIKEETEKKVQPINTRSNSDNKIILNRSPIQISSSEDSEVSSPTRRRHVVRRAVKRKKIFF